MNPETEEEDRGMLDYKKLCFESINTDCIPVQVLFEYSRGSDDIKAFLCGLSESDRPAGELIESIQFELFIFSMDDFKVECTLHSTKSDFFIGDYIEVMHNAFEWLKQIPSEELKLIKGIFEESK